MEPCVFGTLFLMVVGAAILGNQLKLEDRRKRAAQVAAELGLKVVGTDELVGHYDGVGVRCYEKDLGGSGSTDMWTYTRCTLREALPPGMTVGMQGFLGHLADTFGMADIQLGNRLDPALRIGGDNPDEIRELLTEPDVTALLEQVVDEGGRVELKGEMLEVRHRGRHLDQAELKVPEAVGLAQALYRAGLGHWERLAQDHGLNLDSDGRRMDGEVHGVHVVVRLTRISGRRCTVVSAVLDPELPEGTEIRHVDRGAGAATLGDPILDSMVSVRTSDPAALAARVCNETVRGALLEVVHGHPDSLVRSGSVDLVVPGRLGRGLAKAVDAVVALTLGLREG